MQGKESIFMFPNVEIFNISSNLDIYNVSLFITKGKNNLEILQKGEWKWLIFFVGKHTLLVELLPWAWTINFLIKFMYLIYGLP